MSIRSRGVGNVVYQTASSRPALNISGGMPSVLFMVRITNASWLSLAIQESRVPNERMPTPLSP